MHKIGVVGPKASVDRILDIAKEFAKEVQFIPYSYERLEEIAAIIKSHAQEVNGWFFSGPVPYAIAQKTVGDWDNFSYCPTTGAGLFKCCLQIAFQQKQAFERISLDTIENYETEIMLSDLELPEHKIYIKKYSIDFVEQEVTDFHLALWQSGSIDYAITTLNFVYQALKKAGVPAYHSTLTKLEIRQALILSMENVRSRYFKATQVGLIIIQINQYDELIEKAKSPYDLQYLELKIKEILLPLCETLNGYLLDKGNGIYEIFSSRGALETAIDKLKDTIYQLANESGIDNIAGIGFGDTVFSAEVNAHKALVNAKSNKQGSIVIVRDDGVVIEDAGNSEQISFMCHSDNPELLKKLNEAKVSIRTYKKIEAIIYRMNWSEFTSGQLAEQMMVTDRNVRRIIAGLAAVGLVENAGEELIVSRGRPGRVYRLRREKTK